MKIPAHRQEKSNATHNSCVFIQLLHVVYIRETFVEVYIDIVPQMHSSIAHGQIDKCILLVSLFRIPTKYFNNFFKTAFTFVPMAQMFFAKTIKFPQWSHEDFSFGSFQESIFFNPTQKGEIIIIVQSFVFRKA